MKTGNLDGYIHDLQQVVYDSGELGSAQTSITISNLDGDTDQEYELICRFVNGYAGLCNYNLQFNSDSGSNYGFQYMRAQSTATEALRGTGLPSLGVGTNDAQNKICLSRAIISAKSGYERTLTFTRTASITGTTVGLIDVYGGVWNNTADNMTSITITASQTNGVGTGSRIILLKKVNLTSAMKTGDLEVQSDAQIEGAWEKIYETDIDTGTNAIDISSLTGDTDVIYKLIFRFVGGSVSNSQYQLEFNNDSGSNYGTQFFVAADTSISAQRATYAYNLLSNTGTDDTERVYGEMLIYAKSGKARASIARFIDGIVGTTINRLNLFGQIWNNSDDEITSINIDATQSTGIGAGSHVELWRLNL